MNKINVFNKINLVLAAMLGACFVYIIGMHNGSGLNTAVAAGSNATGTFQMNILVRSGVHMAYVMDTRDGTMYMCEKSCEKVMTPNLN